MTREFKANRNAVKALALAWAALAFLPACSKKEPDDLISSITVETASKNLTPPAPEKKVEPPKYAYPHGDKRDPFIPLTGGSRTGSVNLAQNFANLELKGILRDRRGKIAVIAASDGESYTLRGGKVYDRRNRIVSQVTGIIKQESVVLYSQQSKATKELYLAKSRSTQ